MATQERHFKMRSGSSKIDSKEATTAALRAELQIELQNKKQCTYQPYECSQLTCDGYRYCARHILHDKTAPFKQCNYIYSSNGKRCHLPALKGDKKDFGYCTDHALKATLSRNRQNSKFPPPQTAEVLLHSLSHYIKKPRTRTTSHQSDEGGQSSLDDNSELKTTKSLDPFSDIDAFTLFKSKCNDVLDYCSESESDVETSTLGTVWHDAQAESSDNESLDSEQEDLLKHANIYTSEEICVITRDKLIRLQSLYIEEYRHLQHLLKEKRRKYLHSLKREKETCCNIYNQVRDNPKEQRLYKKLKAYNRYQKAHGVDAIFNKRMHDLRAKISDGVASRTHNYSKCSYTEGGVKCGERTLPLARHCRKHILEDPNQVLFRSCGKVRADVECTTPVEAIFDDTTCRLHTEIPYIKTYSLHRKDSESDYDDSLEHSNSVQLLDNELQMPSIENIKTELNDFKLPSEVPKMETVPSMLFEDSICEESEEVTDDVKLENFSVENVKDEIQIDINENNEELPPHNTEEPVIEPTMDVKIQELVAKNETKMEVDESLEEKENIDLSTQEPPEIDKEPENVNEGIPMEQNIGSTEGICDIKMETKSEDVATKILDVCELVEETLKDPSGSENNDIIDKEENVA